MIRPALLAAACALIAGCAAAPAPAPLAAAPVVAGAIKGVHHIGITVSDIDATLAFYRAAVPYELVERRMVPASTFPAEVLAKRKGHVEIALVRTPTVFLQLIDLDPAARQPAERRAVTGPGYTHICFQSPSTAPAYDRFKAHGLAMLSRGEGPVDLGGYGITYAYGFDPDGAMIEMEQLTPQVIAAHGELGTKRARFPAWATHIGTITGDKPALVAFYTMLLGHGPRRELPPTRRATFDAITDIDGIVAEASWFDAGNFELEFWHYIAPVPTPRGTQPQRIDRIGYNAIAFETDDLAAATARLEREGVRFAGKAFTLGGWRVRYARDPEGNLIALQQNVAAGPARSIDAMLWLKDRAPG
ncbi:VOC family protein [Erythrobacter sp. NE805]|uniref:VOC family protein n=1 Tax=Erythrobacter sp. NE805 TaxID=3389875 RepID=UPI00396B11AC